MGLQDYARIYLGETEIIAAYRGNARLMGGPASVPATLDDSAWIVETGEAVGTVLVSLLTLPASGGAPISGFVYSVDGAAGQALASGLGLHQVSGLEPGATVSVRIAALNAVGQAEWSTARTVTVATEPAIAAPLATTAPALSGTAKVGETLVASEGVWTGNPTLTLQWLRNGVEISGVSGASYVLAADDTGATITVRVSATNAGGTTIATSPGAGPVEAASTYEFETDIIILAYGQSNEQAQNNSGGQPYLATDQDSTGRICRWDASTGAAVATGQPMSGWPSLTQGGPARSYKMAQELLARQNPERKIIIVNCAVGGAKLTGSSLGVGGGTYTTMISRMTACLAAYPDAPVFMSFTQGEADANDNVTAANYTNALNAVINNVKALGGQAASMKNFIHQMVPERFFGATADQPYRVVIDAAHKALAVSRSDTAFIAASLGTQLATDPSHFTAEGSRNAGTRAAAWLTRPAMWATTVPSTPVVPVVVSDDTIRITVNDPQPPAYVIEYRASGSTGSWTEQVAYPQTWVNAGESFDVTVAGSGKREVRLKARSYAGTSAASGTILVADPLPVCITAPAITGTATVGATLNLTAGVWSDAEAVTRQWLRDGVAISGATGATYLPTATDLGATISLEETATNATGSSGEISNRLGPVSAATAWSIVGGDASATVQSAPAIPDTPVIASVGDTTATILA